MKPDCEHEAGTHCVHSSERRSFRSCRRRHNWAFREHYLPETVPKPLEFGIAFHEAMEKIYDPDSWENTTDQEKLDAAIEVFKDTCHKQQVRYLKATGQTKLPPGEGYKDDYEERIELGIGMLTHYVREVHPKADTWFVPIAVEVPFSVPLLYPDHPKTIKLGFTPGEQMRCYNSPVCGQEHGYGALVTLNGRIDALVEDKLYGGYLVVDWKTAAQLIINGEFLQLDDQITSYCAALQTVLDIDIRGFLYSEIKKGYPQGLKPLQRTTKGRDLSTAKNQDTSYDVALASMKELDYAGYEAGFYDEFLAWLQSGDKDVPRYHQRFPIMQDDIKLENVMSNIGMEALDMLDPDLLVYPSPSKQNCSGCAYKAPCLGKFNGEDYAYTLKSSFQKRG